MLDIEGGGKGKGLCRMLGEQAESQVRGAREVVQCLVAIRGVAGELVKRAESKMVTRLGA